MEIANRSPEIAKGGPEKTQGNLEKTNRAPEIAHRTPPLANSAPTIAISKACHSHRTPLPPCPTPPFPATSSNEAYPHFVLQL